LYFLDHDFGFNYLILNLNLMRFLEFFH
jgi:hypothetical protein